MRYIQPVEISQERADAWVGKTIRTTTDRLGKVLSAVPTNGRIHLYCVDYFNLVFVTTNERATQVKGDPRGTES
jgi:hypothetical protein